jgi:HEAT repeat protein
MIIATLVALAFQNTAQQALTSYKLSGKDIPAVPPAYTYVPGPSVEYNGWRYGFDSEGRLADRELAASPAADLQQLFSSKSSTAPIEWRTKIVLLERSDILDKSAEGILRQRRSGFLNQDIDHAMQSVSLFGAMVEAYSGGHLKFVPEVQVDDQPMRFDSPAEKPFDAAFAKRYLTPRLNGGAYQPDDKIYRGPYNSVFFIHCGLAKQDVDTDVSGMPVTGLAYYYDYDAKRPGELARTMFNHWVGHLLYAADRHGYQLGKLTSFPRNDFGMGPQRVRLPNGLISDDMWSEISNPKDTSDYPDHYPTGFGADAKPWHEVAGSKWKSLHLIFTVDDPDGSHHSELDEARPVIKTADGYSVEPEYADFVASQLSDPIVLGYQRTADGPRILFRTDAKLQAPVTAVELAGVAKVSFEGPDPKLASSGDLSYTVGDDPEKGKVALLTEDWSVRTGWIRLFGSDLEQPLKSGHYLSLELKSVSAPYDIAVVGKQGVQNFSLFASVPHPAESAIETKQLGLKANGKWQTATIDLKSAEAVTGPITGIFLTPGNASEMEENIQVAPGMVLGSAVLTDSGTASPLLSQPVMSDEDSNSLFAAGTTQENYAARKATLQGLLSAPSEQVDLNAAAAYTRIKDKTAEPRLGDLTKDLDPRIAEMAIEALGYQGTDTARGPLLTALQLGPFESNKYYAAVVLGRQKDPELASFYSDLIIGRDWQTRLAAVNALAAIPGDKAATILVAFLEETDPAIVVTIAQRAQVSQELIAKRMEWYAVNDSFDQVRAWSSLALLRSQFANITEEGYKGLHDDSWVTRWTMLHYFREHPDEKNRNAIRAAVSDAIPEVRAEAVEALAALPQPSNVADLEPVKKDKDPRVQLAILHLAKGKNMKLDPLTVEAFQHSVDPEVRQMMKDLAQ